MTSSQALFEAAKKGDIRLLDTVLDEGVLPIASVENREGDTLAHVASRKGHLQFLKRLVAAGVDVNGVNRTGRALVHEAAQNAQLHVLKYLHTLHADFSALTEKGDSVLDVAKNPEILEYLESILEIPTETETRGAARGKRAGKKRHGKKTGHLSDLKEVHRSEQIVPSETPIERTTHVRQIEGLPSVPVCDLEAVGWGHHACLSFPKRPEWRQLGLDSASALHEHEKASFQKWLREVDSYEDVCSFERNLEYWRELWRVMERGDIYLIIADARNPLLHLHQELLTHLSFSPLPQSSQNGFFVETVMGHPVLVCLNKADLAPAVLLEEWKAYLETALSVIVVPVSCKDEGESREKLLTEVLTAKPFSILEPDSGQLPLQQLPSGWTVLERGSRTVGELIGMDTNTILQFRDAKKIERRKKLSKKARARIQQEQERQKEAEQEAHSDSQEEETDSASRSESLLSQSVRESVPFSGSESGEGVERPLVISVMGEPNVGKSSVLNYLLGIKKVSVSAHPGRTKHLQTHFLCPNLILCDCPGLVFPKRHVPFPMQVLFGGFPIARCRDVYSVVEYLASIISPFLPEILKLTKISAPSEEETQSWSTLDICEAMAAKNKWTTHRGGRWDVYRAANWILRSALAGKDGLILTLSPPSASL